MSHWPSTLARLANTGTVQNARQSLGETERERKTVCPKETKSSDRIYTETTAVPVVTGQK